MPKVDAVLGKKSSPVETRTAYTSLRADGIIFSDCKKGSEHSLQDAKDNIEAIRKVIGFFFIGLNKSQTTETKLFDSKDAAVQWLSQRGNG